MTALLANRVQRSSTQRAPRKSERQPCESVVCGAAPNLIRKHLAASASRTCWYCHVAGLSCGGPRGATYAQASAVTPRCRKSDGLTFQRSARDPLDDRDYLLVSQNVPNTVTAYARIHPHVRLRARHLNVQRSRSLRKTRPPNLPLRPPPPPQHMHAYRPHPPSPPSGPNLS